jgi:hypothetical protein
MQLHQLIGIDVSKEITEQGVPLGSSFYTIALNPDVQFMLQQARSSLSFTPYLKIKLDANIEQGTEPLCTYRVLLVLTQLTVLDLNVYRAGDSERYQENHRRGVHRVPHVEGKIV